MANQQLIEYILQQKANGVSDGEIKSRLIDSGWEEADIEDGFAEIPQPQQPIYQAEEPVIAETPAETEMPPEEKPEIKEEPVTFEPIPEATPPEEKKGPKTLIILIIIAVLAGILGVGTWIVYKKVSKNLFAVTGSNANIINPTEENTPIPLPSVVPAGNQTQTYKNTNYGFSIQTPAGWKSDDSGTSGVIVSLINSVPDSDSGNRFAANVNVVSESTGTLSLDNYVISSKKVLNTSFNNYKIITENKITVNGLQGDLIEATYEMGVYQLHNLQLFIVSNSKAYVVTGTALNSVWSTYKNILSSSIMSFALQ
jgi:hypothetical protein